MDSTDWNLEGFPKYPAQTGVSAAKAYLSAFLSQPHKALSRAPGEVFPRFRGANYANLIG